MYLTGGQWAFTHKVDINNTVEECDESNNSETYTINVLAPQVDGVWYSQIEPDNWNATKLDKLFAPNSSIDSKAHTPFEWNIWEHGEYVNPNGLTPYLDRGHINKWGCIAASLAMVLENVGAETEEVYYDLRTGQTGNMEPDPFTITYANIGYPSIRSESGYYYIDDYEHSNSPVYMSSPNRGRSEVAGDYGYDIYHIDLEGKTTQEKVNIISEQLAKNSEGIMTRISASHTIVINNINSERSRSLDKNYEMEKHDYDSEAKLLTPELEIKIQEKEQQMLKENKFSNALSVKEESEYDDQFIVTDPGTQQTNKGDNVVYNKSWTYENYGGIEKITYIEYID